MTVMNYNKKDPRIYEKSPENNDTMETTDCICPGCGKIYSYSLEISYIVDPRAERRNGYLVVMCMKCRRGNRIDD